LYDVLGVPETATAAVIRRAFRERARQLHPDLNAAPDANARFAELQNAYETLTDPARRTAYDRERRQQRSAPSDAGAGRVDRDAPGSGHYTWSNIAAPRGAKGGGPRGRGPTRAAADFDELYATFYQPRVDELHTAGEPQPDPATDEPVARAAQEAAGSQRRSGRRSRAGRA
jgi:curved DNA-binding protein CbpA